MNESDERAYHGPTIPEPIAEQLQVVFDLEAPPETFGDYVTAMEAVVERASVEPDLNVLCTTDDAPHHATFGGETHQYQCVQDAMIVPYLVADVDAVEIETESPVNGNPIEFSVSEDSIAVDPPSAVLSFGVAADVERPAEDAIGHAYGQVCPYGNAFTDHEEYETWAEDVDARTMATSVEESLELARALGGIGS